MQLTVARYDVALSMRPPASLARALTLVENRAPGWEKALAAAARKAKPAARLGITGPPGAGKSTLVSKLLPMLTQDGPVGVLAVDPSSEFSGGAVLGDRFRLEGASDKVFFRSVAHRGASGGLSLALRGMLTLLESAGKRWVVLESVGVGQAELDILGLADTVVVLLVPESGDYIQALKAGILEAGDILVVNKMDRDGAAMMRDELADVLSYTKSRRFPDWEPRVLLSSARDGKGVPEVLAAVREHRAFLAKEGRLAALRRAQARRAVEELLRASLQRRMGADPVLAKAAQAAAGRVASGKSDPYAEAERLAGRILGRG